MTPHDSLVVATQIAEAKDQILDAIKASKSYTLKDAAPMLGALLVAGGSAIIAVWSLKRNTNYDREKRSDDRKQESLHTIRKIYGELVALNVQLEVEGVEVNAMELSYKYELAKTEIEFDKTAFDDSLNKFVTAKRAVTTIKHQYLALLSEYKFLTGSNKIDVIIDKVSNIKLRLNRDQEFEGVLTINLFEAYRKIMTESTTKIETMVIELGQQMESIILSEKELYS